MIRLTFEGTDSKDLYAQIWAYVKAEIVPTKAESEAPPPELASETPGGNGATETMDEPDTTPKKRRKRRTKAEMAAAREQEEATKTEPEPEIETTPDDTDLPPDLVAATEEAGPPDPNMTAEQAHAEAVALLREIWSSDVNARVTVTTLLGRYNVKTFLEIPMADGFDLLSQTKTIAAEAGVVTS